MAKNLSKILLSLLVLSLTFFICFCKYLSGSLPFCTGLSVDEAELLGDRGGSHLPDLGIHITLQPWLIGVVLGVCVICVVLICVLVHMKHKKTKEIMKQIQENREENKQNRS